MRSYSIIWFGQMASLIGSGMTLFALLVWLYEETGQATSVSLLFLFAYGPSVALSPLAGVIVDRYSRKTIMIFSDALAAVSTIGILVLHQLDILEIWHIYALLSVGGVFHAFQFPALAAATTMLVPKEHYGRASGMLSTAWSISEVVAPLMGALLLGVIGLTGIFLIDLFTFAVAVATLMVVRIPAPKKSKEGEEAKSSWKDDLTFGWRYILARRSLLGLLMVFFTLNFVGTLGWIVMQPMILARTGNDEVLLGTVLALGGMGGIIGGVVMAVWGGTKRKILGLIGGMLVAYGIGFTILSLDGGVVAWSVGIFFLTVFDALIFGSSQSIWQSKVPPDLQGRVFSVRFFIALIGEAPAMLFAGLLADNYFEPLMIDATGPISVLVGSGPGAGMALMILIAGIVGALVSVAAWSIRSIRNVEDILPDHEQEEEKEEDGGDGTEGSSEEAPEEGTGEPDKPRGPPEKGPDEP
jgi:MFS family permease